MFYGTRILAAVQIVMLGYVIYQQRKQNQEIRTMSTNLAALQAVEQQISDTLTILAADITTETDAITKNTTATTAVATEMATLLSEAGEDTTVGQIAGQFQALIDKLNGINAGSVANVANINANTQALTAALPPAPPPAS